MQRVSWSIVIAILVISNAFLGVMVVNTQSQLETLRQEVYEYAEGVDAQYNDCVEDYRQAIDTRSIQLQEWIEEHFIVNPSVKLENPWWNK